MGRLSAGNSATCRDTEPAEDTLGVPQIFQCVIKFTWMCHLSRAGVATLAMRSGVRPSRARSSTWGGGGAMGQL